MTILEPIPSPTFRTARLDDVPALVDLVESAYRGERSREGWTTEADLLDGRRIDADGVTEAITAPGSRLLVAEQAGEPGRAGGAVLACCLIQRRPSAAYFGMFSVRPDRQGGGLGKAVLAQAERAVREEWGAARMELTVIAQRTDLIAWYERRGYRRTGNTSPFPYGDERFGIPRRPDLYFEEFAKPLA